MYIFKVQRIKTKFLSMTLDISDSLKMKKQLTPKYWLQIKQYSYRIHNSQLKLLLGLLKSCSEYTTQGCKEFLYKYSTYSFFTRFFPLPESTSTNSIIYITKSIVTLKYFIALSKYTILMVLIVLWLPIAHWT